MTRLKMTRLVRGIRQAELAKQVGVTRPWLSAIECGWGRPSPAVADRIAAQLQVDVTWLFAEGGGNGQA